jgi:hypothetical protein
MKFIKLTLPDGSEFFVNMSLAYDIYKNENIENSYTTISFGNDYGLTVLESPKAILDILLDLS